MSEIKKGKQSYVKVDTDDYEYLVLKEEVAPLPGEDGESLPTPAELADQAMAEKPKRYHGARTAGLYLEVSPRKVRDLCERGELDAIKHKNHKWIIEESELDRYLAKVKAGKPTTPAAKRKLALVNPEIQPMTEETTGLVTVQQAADYLGFSVEHTRRLYNDEAIAGTKVASMWIMLEADSVIEYGKDIVDGVYLPNGYLYMVDFPSDDEVSLSQLKLVMEHAKEIIRIEVRLREEGIEALEEAGLDVYRKIQPAGSGSTKDTSPLELPEEYAKLLKQARQAKEQ